jgi:hypothetical protein
LNAFSIKDLLQEVDAPASHAVFDDIAKFATAVSASRVLHLSYRGLPYHSPIGKLLRFFPAESSQLKELIGAEKP